MNEIRAFGAQGKFRHPIREPSGVTCALEIILLSIATPNGCAIVHRQTRSGPAQRSWAAVVDNSDRNQANVNDQVRDLQKRVTELEDIIAR